MKGSVDVLEVRHGMDAREALRLLKNLAGLLRYQAPGSLGIGDGLTRRSGEPVLVFVKAADEDGLNDGWSRAPVRLPNNHAFTWAINVLEREAGL